MLWEMFEIERGVLRKMLKDDDSFG